MKTKVWNYAPDRDDCVVQTEESVVFENEHVGWFVANPDPNGRRRLDNMGVVERVGDVVFLACFSSRNALTPEFLGAVKDEATHLRQRVQERLKRREKLPLTYIAAFMALGWDIPLLKHCCPEKFYHKVGCSTEPASGTLTGVVG